MTYNDLLQLYFERSNALQWYWTLYVVIAGGLLAFSSLRPRGDFITTLLVTILFACFAWKNLGALGDTTHQRFAAHKALKEYKATPPPPPSSNLPPVPDEHVDLARSNIEPTLNPDNWESVRNFHVFSDILVIATIWAMERRRRKHAATITPQPP